MDGNTGLKKQTDIEGEEKQLMEEEKVKDNVILVLDEVGDANQNEGLPTEQKRGRKDDKGPSSQEKPKPTYKRVELCIMDKVRVIAAGATGLSQRQIAKQFGISKTQVQTLLKRKEEVMRCYNEGHQGWRKRTISRSRRHSFEDINVLVSKWFSQQVNKDDITGSMLKEKAMEISVELGLGEEFKASNGWLECLKRRYDIQTASHKNTTGESATMVSMKRNQGAITTDFNMNDSGNRDGVDERTSRVNQVENHETMLERREPTIHSVFSIPPPHPVIHSIRSVLLPTPQMYPQQPISNAQKVRPAYPYPPVVNNLQTLAEIVGQEATIRMQIKSYTEALRFANALKAFAVEMGSVTLIGLMTAMEHELQREKKNSSSENEHNQQGTQGHNEATTMTT